MTENKSAGSPLWATNSEAVDDHIMAFCARDDAVLDNQILGDDLRASRAHVEGLCRIGLLDGDESAQLVQAMHVLETEVTDGKFAVGPGDEDGHSAIERRLTEQLGDLGKKVHTGRSRNDQVLVATRLWLKRQLQDTTRLIRDAIEIALEKASQTQDQPMPGYTHLQRAVPSSVGFWFAGHAESWLEDAQAIFHAAELLDTCPLGSAAGYGVNLPLDRQGVAQDLSFSRVQVNGLAVQNSRGRFELHVLHALSSWMLSVRRFAWDLSVFSSAEFGFVTLPARWCTGSSIMPNKRNPDVVELLRSQYAILAGAQSELSEILSLPSGYQRDLQMTKAPMMRGVNAVLSVAKLLPELIGDVAMDAEACMRALSSDLLATDRAVELAKEGVPFRDAYRQVKLELQQPVEESDREQKIKESLQARISLGAPGNLGLSILGERLATLTKMTT